MYVCAKHNCAKTAFDLSSICSSQPHLSTYKLALLSCCAVVHSGCHT